MIKELKKKGDYVAIGAASEKDISEAEEKLGLLFAKEYREYLRQCGAACANGHEFTGIVNSKRLNVVEVTLNEKKKNLYVGASLYVIEYMAIDKIVIWQDGAGDLYQTVGASEPKKMCISFAEYID